MSEIEGTGSSGGVVGSKGGNVSAVPGGVVSIKIIVGEGGQRHQNRG